MTVITDDYMRERLKQAASYNLVILKRAAGYDREDARAIIWEHGRRNTSLQADGLLPIVCPVPDASEIAGVGQAAFKSRLHQARIRVRAAIGDQALVPAA